MKGNMILKFCEVIVVLGCIGFVWAILYLLYNLIF